MGNKPTKPRNRLATHPLLRKGGSHEKPLKTERASARREIRNILASRERDAHRPSL
jgi:hypothetical protein